MQNIYIVKTKDNKLHCFYHTNESGINMRTYEQGKWGKSINIFPDAAKNYTVTLSKDGSFCVFCSDTAGNINSCTNDGGSWNTQLILRNQSPIIHDVIFYPIFNETGAKLIYNVPSPEDKTHFLMTQSLAKNGEWGTPSRLDRISPFSGYLFTTQLVSENHAIVFYKTKTPETNLGYREVTSVQSGNFNIFHTTSYQISDASFLTTSDFVHAVYVVKSMFSSRLIYKKRDSEGFSSPITIWEGNRIESCLLFFAKSRLHIAFVSQGYVYTCQSDDLGETFSRTALYKEKFCQNPVKAVFLSETEMKKSKYYCREVYVDKQNPYAVQFLPEMFDDFYPTANLMPDQKIKPQQPLENESLPKSEQTPYDPFMPPPDYEEFSRLRQSPDNHAINYQELIAKMKSSMRTTAKELAEKNNQLVNYSNLIKARNNDITTSELTYKKERTQLERDLAELTAQLDKLKSENETLLLKRQQQPEETRDQDQGQDQERDQGQVQEQD